MIIIFLVLLQKSIFQHPLPLQVIIKALCMQQVGWLWMFAKSFDEHSILRLATPGGALAILPIGSGEIHG